MSGLINAFIFALFVSVLTSCSMSIKNYRSGIDLSETWGY